MTHWSDGYIDIPHAELDCAELVARVLREQLGRVVNFPRKQSDNLFHRAALVTQHASDFAARIAAPVDGCGVLMLARGRMSHIGLFCAIDQGYVLHSDSAFGASVRVPLNRVRVTHRIEGFYAWLD